MTSTNDLDQYKRGNYGFDPLSGFIDRYMAHSFNNSRKYYKNMLIIGADLYKELYWKTLKVTKNKRVAVDRQTMTVKVPHDCLRILGVRIKDDCDHAQPLTYDPYKMIGFPSGKSGCGCKKCSCDAELCAHMNAITYSTEDMDMNGTSYQRVIKTRVHPNGDMVREISEPYAKKVLDPETDALETVVVYHTRTECLTSLSVKPCGCIEPTPANKQKCVDFCGCPVTCCSSRYCEPTQTIVPGNRHGHYKIDDDQCMIYLFDSSACYVEISYITNGEECAEEIVIPEYCKEAMYAGLYYGSIRFRQGLSRLEKREAGIEFEYQQQKLYEFLNPLVPHEFKELQYSFPKW